MKAERNNRVARRARVLCAALALASVPAGLCVACGGSTGREGLPQPPGIGMDSGGDTTISIVAEANTDDVASADTTRSVLEASSIDSNEGGFDAGIEYADATRRPDVLATSGAGADAGGPTAKPWDTWPVCKQDTPVSTNPADLCASAVGEIPDDAGVCPTYRWVPSYGDASATCEQCLRDNTCGICKVGVFPPCSDLREAGTAAQGPGAGKPLYDLCAALFECVVHSNCLLDGIPARPDNCYCGTASGAACINPGAANGACKAEIEAAGQVSKSTVASDVLSHITDVTHPTYHPSSEVMALFNCINIAATVGPSGPTKCTMCSPPARTDGG